MKTKKKSPKDTCIEIVTKACDVAGVGLSPDEIVLTEDECRLKKDPSYIIENIRKGRQWKQLSKNLDMLYPQLSPGDRELLRMRFMDSTSDAESILQQADAMTKPKDDEQINHDPD